MNLSWKEKRDRLFRLIKQVSDEHGGGDVEYLREYAKEVLEAYKDYLETAILCFEDVCSGSRIKLRHDEIKSIKTNVCDRCGLVPPFCYYCETNICSKRTRNVLHGTLEDEN